MSGAKSPRPPTRLILRHQSMFQKDALDALFNELDTRYAETPDYDQLLRDAHLGIALSDAGREYESQVDDRVATLIGVHKTDG